MTKILEIGTEVMINNTPIYNTKGVRLEKDGMYCLAVIVDYDERDKMYTVDLGKGYELYFTESHLDLV